MAERCGGAGVECGQMSLDFYEALTALDWQVELGADECIGETPVNRFETKVEKPLTPAVVPQAEAKVAPIEPEAAPELSAISAQIAASCATLDDLKSAIMAFEGCELKRGAKNTVFSDGNPAAELMIVGEAPGREEDAQGVPFAGQAGQLLDKMFGAIDRARGGESAEAAIYMTSALPWRPLQNRDPSAEDIAMLRPFLMRHIALVEPKVLVLMGNTACKALLEMPRGITSLRGTWQEIGKTPAMPMFHPAALLRDPLKKKPSWADLLAIKSRLAEG